MRKRITGLLLAAMCAASTVACPIDSCDGRYRMERSFFSEPVGTRVDRLRRYALPDQYRIFRYGMDRREPRDSELADPIAERGKMVVPFLLEQLDQTPDDKTVDDVLILFEAMSRLKTYDVRRDLTLTTTLSSKVSSMTHESWKAEAMRTLETIRRPF